MINRQYRRVFAARSWRRVGAFRPSDVGWRTGAADGLTPASLPRFAERKFRWHNGRASLQHRMRIDVIVHCTTKRRSRLYRAAPVPFCEVFRRWQKVYRKSGCAVSSGCSPFKPSTLKRPRSAPRHARRGPPPASRLRKARPLKPAAAVRAPAKREAPRPAARESRVRPRASAWASGSWTRSFHSAPAAPGRLVNHLQYGLYVPSGHALESMPLVVMLHGCTQSIDEFAEGTRMNVLADRFGFAVVYPEQSKHVHSHRCWHWYDAGDSAGGAEARAVVSLVDALVAQHGFDRERVYVGGISAGAGLTALLAAQLSGAFRRSCAAFRPSFRRGPLGHYRDGRDAARRASRPGRTGRRR